MAEKAKIKVFRGSGTEDISVLFNPEEYSINRDNNLAVQGIPGLSGPIVQFVHGNLRTLEMELLFDTWETKGHKDVRKEYTNKIIGLMEIDPELHAPPLLLVSWASLQFRCLLARVNQKFTMFDSDGKPVRARLTCTFNEVIDPKQEAREVNRQTVDFSKVHVVAQGETLSGLATRFYNAPETWRPIAVANGIDDPRGIFPGQSLLIPSLPFIDPLTRLVTK